ncbi:MAG: hypothetical protein IPG32_16405, partial [Saprospirales bacterium]|nr:hypothetical protein [Saprospirales bacterium]
MYGSPRVGNRDFMDAYNELLEEKTFLHINNRDIVAQIPPRILGFNHLGGSPRLFDKEHAISLIPKSRGIFEEEETEMDFEGLDEAAQEAIMNEMKEAQQCIEVATRATLELPAEAIARVFFSISRRLMTIAWINTCSNSDVQSWTDISSLYRPIPHPDWRDLLRA